MKKRKIVTALALVVAGLFSLQTPASALSCVGPFSFEEMKAKGNYPDYFIGTVTKHDDKEKITTFDVQKGWGGIKETKLTLYGDLNWGESFQAGSRKLLFVTSLDNSNHEFLSKKAQKTAENKAWVLPLCSFPYTVHDIEDAAYQVLGASNELKVSVTVAKSEDGDNETTGILWLPIGIAIGVAALTALLFGLNRKKKKTTEEPSNE